METAEGQDTARDGRHHGDGHGGREAAGSNFRLPQFPSPDPGCVAAGPPCHSQLPAEAL